MFRKQLSGIGLTPRVYGLLLAVSIGLFLFWGGPLWSAGRDASHFSRIAISYLAVMPLAASLLAWRRQLSWTHFLTTCGSAWAIKLVITVVLYEAFAGAGAPLEARKAKEASTPTLATRYHPSQDAFPKTTLTGTVTRDGLPVRDAVVFLDAPPAGMPVEHPRSVELVIEGAKYPEAIYVVRRSDSLVIINRDATLHTVRFAIGGRAHSSQPLPASPTPRALVLPAPGLYRLSCANHGSESAWLLVLDHPYVTRTDESGLFTLKDVPLGELNATAIAAFEEGLLRGSIRTAVGQAGSATTIPLGAKVVATAFERKP